MTYELAKELKDAGWVGSELVTPMWYGVRDIEYLGVDDLVPNPTLSELIEACPKQYDSTVFNWTAMFSLTWCQDKWLAGYEKYETVDLESWGSTPDEAVAKLYIALNKK